jgi:hypothetical protein
MAYPLNQDVKKPYSLEFLDGYLKISNGIGGSFCFPLQPLKDAIPSKLAIQN